MILQDLHNRLAFAQAFAPVVATDNTAINTAIVDMQGKTALELVLVTGTLADADATFAVTGTHGDVSDLSDGVAMTALDVIGSFAAAGFTFADDNVTRKIGYRGGVKRYARFTVTPTGNAGNAPLAGVFIYQERQEGYVA